MELEVASVDLIECFKTQAAMQKICPKKTPQNINYRLSITHILSLRKLIVADAAKYTVSQRKDTKLLTMYWPNIDLFSKFFHWYT